MNFAAHLTAAASQYDHTTLSCTDYNVCAEWSTVARLMYQSLSGQAPAYLDDQ